MRTLKIYFVRIQMKFGVVRYAWLFVLLRVRACVRAAAGICFPVYGACLQKDSMAAVRQQRPRFIQAHFRAKAPVGNTGAARPARRRPPHPRCPPHPPSCLRRRVDTLAPLPRYQPP